MSTLFHAAFLLFYAYGSVQDCDLIKKFQYRVRSVTIPIQVDCKFTITLFIPSRDISTSYCAGVSSA